MFVRMLSATSDRKLGQEWLKLPGHWLSHWMRCLEIAVSKVKIVARECHQELSHFRHSALPCLKYQPWLLSWAQDHTALLHIASSYDNLSDLFHSECYWPGYSWSKGSDMASFMCLEDWHTHTWLLQHGGLKELDFLCDGSEFPKRVFQKTESGSCQFLKA